MGEFYGSVQVRSEDCARVKMAAEQVGREMKLRLLVSPPRNGWTSRFPENHGQDEAVGRAIAERLNGDVLHLIVHDGDVFAYWLYRDGRLMDSYWSSPGYFGEETRAKEEAMTGNPEAFRPIIGDRIKKLPALLERHQAAGFLGSEQLEVFARLLKVPNALNAYEYLKEGERVNVKGWREFEEVPEELVQRTRIERKQTRRDLLAERERLKSQRILLLCHEQKDAVPIGCATDNRFLVTWLNGKRVRGRFNEYCEPWTEPTLLQVPKLRFVNSLAVDGAGRRIAMGTPDRATVWERTANTWNPRVDIPTTDPAFNVSISGDGQMVSHLARTELVLTNVGGPERLFAFTIEGDGKSAFHPDGHWLAIAGNPMGLVSLQEEPHWRHLYVGGRFTPPDVTAGAAFLARTLDIDVDDLEKERRKLIEETIAKLGATKDKSGKPIYSEAEIEKSRMAMEKWIDESRDRLTRLKLGRFKPPKPLAYERANLVGFTRDGRWLWCATDIGLRVYWWDRVPRADDSDMPAPSMMFGQPNEPIVGRGNITAVTEEIGGGALIIAVSTGHLYRLDLATGAARELLKVPGHVVVIGVFISPDGVALGISAIGLPPPGRSFRQHDRINSFQIFAYQRLLDL